MNVLGTRRGPVGRLLALLCVLGSGLACAADTTANPEDAAAIQEVLEGYLPRLAMAYANGDAAILEGYAAEKEIAGMNKRIRDLLNESRELRPRLKSVVVEEVFVWSHANAFATTLEVWDLQVYASGTQSVLSEANDQTNRVKYQLKRVGDSWLVLFREIETTFE